MGMDRAKQLRIATYASVATAVVLVSMKLGAWLMTGSVSILASLMDSLMDSAASALNLLAVRYSLMPADKEHRFGHGKAEPLAGLAQAAFISGSAVFLILHAVERLRFPRAVEEVGIGVAVMVVSIVLTALLLLIQRRAIQQTQSSAIRADALHYATDLLTNLTVIVALLLSKYGWVWADSAMAMSVAIYIFYSAARIGYAAVQQLRDREPGAETKRNSDDRGGANPKFEGSTIFEPGNRARCSSFSFTSSSTAASPSSMPTPLRIASNGRSRRCCLMRRSSFIKTRATSPSTSTACSGRHRRKNASASRHRCTVWLASACRSESRVLDFELWVMPRDPDSVPDAREQGVH